jgi:hypothetical protein
MLTRVRIRRLTTDAEEEVDLGSLGTATYVLLEVDAARREVSVWRNDRPAIVGFDGRPIRELDVPDGIRPQSSTYLSDQDRWVVWDAYQEDGRYAAAWSTPNGVRRHIVPLGRSITSAALAPGGRYVAFSTTTTLSIGQIRDSVFVVQTDTGTEVFRRYFPTYTRSTVGFVNGSFVYSDIYGTHVLTMRF